LVAALQLDLSDISSFESMVQSFINGSPHEKPNGQNARIWNLWKTLDNMRITRAMAKLEEQIRSRNEECDVHNLTRNLLYETEINRLLSQEMDTLLVLPTSRLIIGKNHCFLLQKYTEKYSI
jgi:hypothetical protein